LGGDDFLWSSKINRCSESIAGSRENIKSIATPFLLADEEHSITASIGISVYPLDGEDRINLLKHADIAMYRAKEKHNTYEYYSLTR
jgi:diguanylate cyclase (GGDEF)-like protein